VNRLRLFIILGGMSALGPASMDIYLPGLPSVSRDLGVGASTTALTVTTFLIGMGAGQVISGPASDIFGRRRPLFAGIAVYVLATVVCALAPSAYVLIGARLAQGCGAAAGLVIARAIVRDLYSGSQAARYFSRLVLIMGMAPALAPLVGGQLLRVTSWRGVFAVIVIFGLLMIGAAMLWLPETLAPTRRRHGGLKETGRTFRVLLRDRAFVGYGVTLGIGAGVVIAYVAGAPFLIEDVHGGSPQLFSVLFGLNAVGLIISSQVNAHFVERVEPRRLLIAAIWALLGAALLLLLATLMHLGLWAIIPCLFVMMATWGVIPANLIALALNDHAATAGSASALLGLFQYGIGGLVAPIVGIGGEKSGLSMALVILTLSVSAVFSITLLTQSTTRPLAVDPLDVLPLEV
jgi:DHA1 family bicyclomycin/chloramphenicol resistance-like MFS transporter